MYATHCRELTKITRTLCIFSGLLLLLSVNLYAQAGNQNPKGQAQIRESSMQLVLIDRFVVPSDARVEFLQRMSINRNFIRKLPGFIGDAASEQIGGDSEFNYVTVAVWKNAEAFENARKAVVAEYQKQNFDLQGMLKRQNIKIDRAIYKKLED